MTRKPDALMDPEAERTALASCLTYPEQLTAIELSDRDFAVSSHRDIWNAVAWLAAEGEHVDTLRVRDRLADTGRLEAVGGLEALVELTDGVPVRNPPTDRLRRLTRLRGMRDAVRRVQLALEEADLDEAVSALATAHESAMGETGPRERTWNVLELCMATIQDLSDRRSGVLIHPGFELLEKVLGSLRGGQTVGVLANTNVGKSSFMLETFVRAAQRNVACGYISVEDQRDIVGARLTGMFGCVSSRKILQRQVSAEDMAQLSRGFVGIQNIEKNMHVRCMPGGSEVDVCAAMGDMAARGCKIIGVDYLQKISSTKSYANRAHEAANIASRITSQAQRLGSVLFLASQCSRDKARMNECPTKHDMKESGDLENMLDAVIGIWREYEDDFAPMWCRLLKVKWGGVGRHFGLQRSQSTGRLEEVPDSDQMEPPDARGDWSHRKGGR